jgi:hypothetical protein
MFKRGSYSLLVANRALEGLERKISCAARAERGNTAGRRPLFFRPDASLVCRVSRRGFQGRLRPRPTSSTAANASSVRRFGTGFGPELVGDFSLDLVADMPPAFSTQMRVLDGERGGFHAAGYALPFRKETSTASPPLGLPAGAASSSHQDAASNVEEAQCIEAFYVPVAALPALPPKPTAGSRARRAEPPLCAGHASFGASSGVVTSY